MLNIIIDSFTGYVLHLKETFNERLVLSQIFFSTLFFLLRSEKVVFRYIHIQYILHLNLLNFAYCCAEYQTAILKQLKL